jgi:hypothetical protein
VKIKDYNDPLGRIVDVFSIYWFDNDTYFYGLPKNHGGLKAYKASEVEVIDPEIKFHTIYFYNNARSVHHWALIKERLLDGIIEHDETAYNRFLEILKAEGQIDPDFC